MSSRDAGGVRLLVVGISHPSHGNGIEPATIGPGTRRYPVDQLSCQGRSYHGAQRVAVSWLKSVTTTAVVFAGLAPLTPL